ncbi:MAG: hypothetical protein JWP12_431 [Bacteroidetes bacterium]|nr:hypothetical protein [Bacteroidota bacterium]
MKKQIFTLSTLLLLVTAFAGCEVVGGIFKAGMAWGIILVLLVIGGIIWLISRGGKK